MSKDRTFNRAQNQAAGYLEYWERNLDWAETTLKAQREAIQDRIDMRLGSMEDAAKGEKLDHLEKAIEHFRAAMRELSEFQDRGY